MLVPGCGSGHDVRALARGGADVWGLDLAPSAVAKAERFPRAGSESYHEGDWLNLKSDFEACFDWVVEHTCFCALDPSLRTAYVESVGKALRPGGTFLGVFYLRPRAENGPPFGVTESELDAYFRRFELKEKWTPTAAYPGREGREEMRVYRKEC